MPGRTDRPDLAIAEADAALLVIRRACALAVDGVIILIGLWGVLSVLANPLGIEFDGDAVTTVVFVLISAAVIVYFAVFAHYFKSTPGQLVLRLQVVSIDGTPPSFRKLLARSALKLIEINLVWLAFFHVVVLKHHRSFSDKISGTYVIPHRPHRY